MRLRTVQERGTSLILIAASMFLLLAVTALVVDLSGIRLDRAVDQRVTDAAASAGAIGVFESGGVAGCQEAIAYTGLNLGIAASLSTTGCTAIPATCDPATPVTVSQVVDRFRVDVVYPVPDGHPLMKPGTLGDGAQSVVPDDKDSCDRIGVLIASERPPSFAGILGAGNGATTVHSVAIAAQPPSASVPLNVLILDRFGCETMKVSGNGGIIVDGIYNPVDHLIEPGVAAADSDGTSADCPPSGGLGGVIAVEGTNSVMRADGPAGCASQNGTSTKNGLGVGHGCGLIQVKAPGTPGCNVPACTASGGASPNNPRPEPTALPTRLTRAPIDYRYNCRVDYSTIGADIDWATDALTAANEQDIPGCASGGDDHIHDLIREVGSSSAPVSGSWQRWADPVNPWAADGSPCVIEASAVPIAGLTGNWYIDCADFDVKQAVSFSNASVVVDGSVHVTSSTGFLTIDNAGSADPGFLFLRGGVLAKDGQASIALQEVMVYLSASSRVQMDGGGTGSLTWIAPDEDGHRFDDLALWSDSTVTSAPHFWAGQAALDMEGVFFVPIVTVEYAGQGSQQQASAQFVADRLHARGQGVLKVSPQFGRAVDFFGSVQSTLIR